MTGNAQDRSLPVCCCDLATIDKTGNSTATTTQTIFFMAGSYASNFMLLKPQPEAELQGPRRVGQIRARLRLSERRIVFAQLVAPVVHPVERVEDVDVPVDRPLATERHALLQPNIDAVDGQADKGLARDDRAHW